MHQAISMIGVSAVAAIASNVSAVELIRNGGFETGPQFNADFWVKPDLGFNEIDGEPNNYARVGNWVNQAGTDPNGFAFGPHPAGQGTGTQIAGRTAWLGGVNGRTSIIQQPVNTVGYNRASLTFKVVYEDVDIVGRDFLYVDFGPDRVLTIDLGAAYVNFVNQFGVVRQGGLHFWTLVNPTIDLSPYFNGTTKNLTFTVVNDAVDGISSAWFDNVSINASVPEPATLAALGLLGVVVGRRRA